MNLTDLVTYSQSPFSIPTSSANKMCCLGPAMVGQPPSPQAHGQGDNCGHMESLRQEGSWKLLAELASILPPSDTTPLSIPHPALASQCRLKSPGFVVTLGPRIE